MSITHEEIVTNLRDEALDEPETGWLSDMGAYNPDQSRDGQSIEVGNGSIDLSHLASIVQAFMSIAWLEGRESVAVDMASPIDESGTRKASKNPYV